MITFYLQHTATQRYISLQVQTDDRRLPEFIGTALGSCNHLTIQTAAAAYKESCRHLSLFDCRASFPPNSASQTLDLALITPDVENRTRTFATGFTDFILWPLVPEELAVRLICGCCTSPIEKAKFEFSRIPLIEKICRHLIETLDQPHSVAALAKRFNSNHNTINRLFNEELGLPPIAWQRKARLAKAARMLVESDESVTELAAQCGYATPSNFTTAFKRNFGTSPLAYRKMNAAKFRVNAAEDMRSNWP